MQISDDCVYYCFGNTSYCKNVVEGLYIYIWTLPTSDAMMEVANNYTLLLGW